MTGTELRHAQGTPCWVSLLTHDLGAAERFYGALLGWTFTPGPEDLGPYVRALLGGLPVAGLGVMPPGAERPADWITYFAADDADEAAQRVREHGGTVALGPLDSDSAGRLVVAADLDGAVFGVWQGRDHPGFRRQREPGAVAWSELSTPAATGAARFYAGTFGSAAVETGRAQVERFEDHVVLKVGGHTVAGIRQAPATAERPRWRVFFAVTDADDTAARAVALGGRVESAPADSPYGRIALLRDTEDGPFAVVRLPD
ncbi:VOC family protein [Streptacidiphilus sp. EB129]|uniref:VOC family protein n=1 Tax=Streptacidiphilus sp. EB129 TaxID=3156262 RepID=UPI0035145080